MLLEWSGLLRRNWQESLDSLTIRDRSNLHWVLFHDAWKFFPRFDDFDDASFEICRTPWMSSLLYH